MPCASCEASRAALAGLLALVGSPDPATALPALLSLLELTHGCACAVRGALFSPANLAASVAHLLPALGAPAGAAAAAAGYLAALLSPRHGDALLPHCAARAAASSEPLAPQQGSSASPWRGDSRAAR